MFVTLVTILLLSVHGTRTKAIGNLENFRVLIRTLPGPAAYLGNSWRGLIRRDSSIALGIARNSATQLPQVRRTERHAQSCIAPWDRTVARGRAGLGKWLVRVGWRFRPQAMIICNDACTLDITGLDGGCYGACYEKMDMYVQMSLDFKAIRVIDASWLTSLRGCHALSHYLHVVIFGWSNSCARPNHGCD